MVDGVAQLDVDARHLAGTQRPGGGDEELAAAREANRRLMTELNHNR